MEMDNEIYLGDGVYAEWTGWSVILKANDHKNPTDTIELEDSVLIALNDFVKMMKRAAEEKKQ